MIYSILESSKSEGHLQKQPEHIQGLCITSVFFVYSDEYWQATSIGTREISMMICIRYVIATWHKLSHFLQVNHLGLFNFVMISSSYTAYIQNFLNIMLQLANKQKRKKYIRFWQFPQRFPLIILLCSLG